MNHGPDSSRIDEVLAFWFEELTPDDWFGGGEAVDDRIRDRFLALHEALRQAGVWHLAGLQREVERSWRRRLSGVEGLEPLPLLQRYLVSRDTPPQRQEALLDAAAGLLRDVENDSH